MSRIPHKYRGCYSIESMAAHGAEGRKVQKVDEFVIDRYKYIIYQDETGTYWYRNQIRKGKVFVDVEVALFGKNPPKKYYRH